MANDLLAVVKELAVIAIVPAVMILFAYLVIVWLPNQRGQGGRQVGWGFLYLGLGTFALGSVATGWSHRTFVDLDAALGFLWLALAAYKFWGPVRA